MNPRMVLPIVRFRVECLKPLSHPSVLIIEWRNLGLSPDWFLYLLSQGRLGKRGGSSENPASGCHAAAGMPSSNSTRGGAAVSPREGLTGTKTRANAGQFLLSSLPPCGRFECRGAGEVRGDTARGGRAAELLVAMKTILRRLFGIKRDRLPWLGVYLSTYNSRSFQSMGMRHLSRTAD